MILLSTVAKSFALKAGRQLFSVHTEIISQVVLRQSGSEGQTLHWGIAIRYVYVKGAAKNSPQ